MPVTNQENLIDWFEAQIGMNYPEKIRTLLNSVVASDYPVEILFEVSSRPPAVVDLNYKVLDFKVLWKIKGNSVYTPAHSERYSNPYFVIGEIQAYATDYIKDNKELLAGKILPFARDVDGDGYRYLYFMPDKSEVFYVDLNTEHSKGDTVMSDIEEFLGPVKDIVRDISEENKTSFHIKKASEIRRNKPRIEQFIKKENTFIYDGECIRDVMSYQWIIEKMIGLTDNAFKLESFEGVEGDTVRTIKVTINGIVGQFDLEGDTDWLDSRLVGELNAMLKPMLNEKYFIEITDDRWGQEFGVAYAGDASFEVLKKHGFIP